MCILEVLVGVLIQDVAVEQAGAMVVIQASCDCSTTPRRLAGAPRWNGKRVALAYCLIPRIVDGYLPLS